MSLRAAEQTLQLIHHKEEKLKPDGGWGWVIVISSLVICSMCDGYTYSMNQFYNQFLIEYQQSESITSIYCSVMTCSIMAISPFASGMITVYGSGPVSILGSIMATLGIVLSVFLDKSLWFQVLTIGLLAGCGIGIVFISQVIVVAYWFDKKVAIATGIAECGSGFGMAIFAIVVNGLINLYGWRGAQLILAGLMSICIAFSTMHCQPTKTISCSWRQCFSCQKLRTVLKETINFRLLVTHGRFALFVLSNIILNFCFFEPIVVTSDRIKRTRMGTESDAANLMVYFGIANGIGRILFGGVATCSIISQMLLYIICTTVMGFFVILTNVANNIATMSCFYFGIGLFYGGNVCLCSVVLIHMLGHENMANAYSIVTFFDGFASLIGPPILNQFVDKNRNKDEESSNVDIYSNIIMISGVLTILSAMMLLCNKFVNVEDTGKLNHELVEPSEKIEKSSESPILDLWVKKATPKTIQE